VGTSSDRPGRGAGPERRAGQRPRPAGASAGDDDRRSGGRRRREDDRSSRRGAPPQGAQRRGERPPRSDARRSPGQAPREDDPRRAERRAAAGVPLPDDVEARMLDPEVRTELRALAKDTAERVARHLVVAGRLVDDDPAEALRHARAARALAGRVGVVREACGLAAYAAGEWAEALAELRAARRITGEPSHLAVMADCERALGRPERALTYDGDPHVARLGQPERVELAIVLSGARRDLGQGDAAVVLLQGPARRTRPGRPFAARLWYAYADALLDVGRRDEAREWFAAAADVDRDGETDAAERLLELDGVVLEDLGPHDDTVGAGAQDPAQS
jgi:tetratricopeptide (TPR) repeat protein